jgi:hypothetical protein
MDAAQRGWTLAPPVPETEDSKGDFCLPVHFAACCSVAVAVARFLSMAPTSVTSHGQPPCSVTLQQPPLGPLLPAEHFGCQSEWCQSNCKKRGKWRRLSLTGGITNSCISSWPVELWASSLGLRHVRDAFLRPSPASCHWPWLRPGSFSPTNLTVSDPRCFVSAVIKSPNHQSSGIRQPSNALISRRSPIHFGQRLPE